MPAICVRCRRVVRSIYREGDEWLCGACAGGIGRAGDTEAGTPANAPETPDVARQGELRGSADTDGGDRPK